MNNTTPSTVVTTVPVKAGPSAIQIVTVALSAAVLVAVVGTTVTNTVIACKTSRPRKTGQSAAVKKRSKK